MAIYFIDCISSFNLLNQTTEACLGDILTFECSTAPGLGVTVFQGDLLDCNYSFNKIVLAHSRFSNTSAATSETCNNGRIRGYSLPINGSEPCYISQLHVMISSDMIGKSIICIDDSGTTANEIGNFLIEQCHATIVTKTVLSTGKLIIHVGKSFIFLTTSDSILWTGTDMYMHNNSITIDMHIKGTYMYSLQHLVSFIIS